MTTTTIYDFSWTEEQGGMLTEASIRERDDESGAHEEDDDYRKYGAPIGEYLRTARFGPQSYVVIVTRGHKGDQEALYRVLGAGGKRGPDNQVRYVGMIGSRRKTMVILENLRTEGVAEEDLRRVHAPIGVEIGSITPAEIALSIAAELVAVRRGASAPRRRGGSPIEQPDARSRQPAPATSDE